MTPAELAKVREALRVDRCPYCSGGGKHPSITGDELVDCRACRGDGIGHEETRVALAILESENAKLKDELAAAQEAHALDRAPMLRAMAVFDEGADDERWTPGVHVVDALIADHAKLRDLLRRVRGCFRNGETPATIAIELSTLMPEIKAAVEPAGEPGEVEVA